MPPRGSPNRQPDTDTDSEQSDEDLIGNPVPNPGRAPVNPAPYIETEADLAAHRIRVAQQREEELKYIADTSHLYEDIDVILGRKPRKQ